MALKTRILLRNDELSNWTGSSLVLGKGEMAIATLDGEYVEVRVGDGTHTWAESYKLKVTAAQISGLVETIQGTAKKYQIVANGSTTNSWKLQSAALSGGEWTDVGEAFTIELSDYYTKDEVDQISANLVGTSSDLSADNTIGGAKKYADGKAAEVTDSLTAYALSTDVDTVVNAAKSEVIGTDTDTSSANTIYGAKAYADEVAETAAKTYANNLCAELSTTTAGTYLSTATFDAYKDEVGLTAASASNQVATKADISALDGVMHFKGVVNAVPTSTEGYEVGDVVLVTGSSVEGDNGKEFVLVEVGGNKKWEQIGDQDHYATKSYVDTGDSNTLTASKAYTDGKITDISGTITSTYATKTDLTSTAHDLSTDYNTKFAGLTSTYATKTEVSDTSSYLSGAVDDLSNAITAITGTYATKDYVNGISSSLSTDYVSKIGTAKTEAYNEALSDANNYTNGKIDALSDTYIKHREVTESDLCGFFILDCGASTLRPDEPTDLTSV